MNVTISVKKLCVLCVLWAVAFTFTSCTTYRSYPIVEYHKMYSGPELPADETAQLHIPRPLMPLRIDGELLSDVMGSIFHRSYEGGEIIALVPGRHLITVRYAEGITYLSEPMDTLFEFKPGAIYSTKYKISQGKISVWIEEGGSLQIPEVQETGKLEYAAERGDSQAVKTLLNATADVDSHNGYGDRTALMMAASKGHTDIITMLIDNGADINAKDKNGWSALMRAYEGGHYGTVLLLLDKGADENPDVITKDGWTTLMMASKGGLSDVVKVLLKNNIDINATNKGGLTALMLASWHGHSDIVQMLLDNGADVNKVDKDGWTALMFASRYGTSDSVQMLLDNGTDVSKVDKDGWTALMMASRYGRNDSVRILLDKGADPNIQKKDGWTALTLASFGGHADVVKALLNSGADVQERDLKTAREKQHYNILNLLRTAREQK